MVNEMIPVKSDHLLESPQWRRFESPLMATSKLMRRAYDLRFSEFNLNLSEAGVLAVVIEEGPLTQTQVAERIGMGRAPVGIIVDYLSERQLLSREPNSADRRVWLLSATAEGLELAMKISLVEQQLRAELRKGLSRVELEQLNATHVRLQSNLAAILDVD
jgi:DNA-binding MarR family transcriptional regulator